jgi:hypothetical protein
MRPNSRHLTIVALAVASLGLLAWPAPGRAAGVCDVPLVSTACDVVGGAASGAAGAVADGALGALTGWVLDGAVWLLGQVIGFVLQTTTPKLDSGFFQDQYRTMGVLMAAVLLPMLLLALVQGLVRQDWGQLLRSVFVGVPGAVILTAVAATLVQSALVVTDGFATFVIGGGDTQTTGFIDATGTALKGLGDGGSVPAFVAFLIAVLTAVAGLVLWLELLVRSAGIYVCVLFMPLTLAAMVWPVTGRWVRRLVEVLVALVLSKLVIVAIISLAAATLTGGVSDGSVTAVLAGAVMLLLACMSPFALLHLIPLVESGNPGRHTSAAGSTVRTVLTAGQMYGAIMQTRAVSHLGASGLHGAGGGGGGGGPTGGAGGGLPLGPRGGPHGPASPSGTRSGAGAGHPPAAPTSGGSHPPIGGSRIEPVPPAASAGSPVPAGTGSARSGESPTTAPPPQMPRRPDTGLGDQPSIEGKV